MEETEIMQNPEGANTFTLLHRTLNMCTNSMQYNMMFDIVNDLLLYVEPQQKVPLPLNSCSTLLDEPQLKVAILRDQESLRSMVNYQRQLERELWSMLREVDQKLHGLSTAVRPASAQASYRPPPPLSADSAGAALLVRFDAGDLPPTLAHDVAHILAFEESINQLKASIVEMNSLLSQSIAYYQQLRVQSQRKRLQFAMSGHEEAVNGGTVSARMIF
ncbi:unnamed protein product [Dibothriocephalus latus]|uniref:Uncharacterized protein n=1 Tax=Dibothriocephalus latus TaxID=60516 RepID=A0A3P7R6H5_DIBLA|nr:unnamed protein product [Dibothriocephalus latus]